MAEDTEFEDQEMIDFKCPYCGESVSFPGMNAGMAQDCPFCMQVFLVPNKSSEAGRKFPLPINTQRLVLRRLASEDADALAQIVCDEESLAFHALPAKEEEDVKDWLEADAKVELSRLNPELFLAIALRDSGTVIGLVSIKYGNGDFQAPEITVVVSRSEQRKGYGTEALRGLLGFGFRGLNMRRITAHCHSKNTAFIGLAEKIGLRQEGTGCEDRYFNGEWVDTAYYAMLQREFQDSESKTT